MSTNATVAYESFIAYSVDGMSYTTIAQSKDLNGPEAEVGDINITNNDSPDNTKEYIPGMIEPGELEFKLIYKKDMCATIYDLLGDGNVYFWKEEWPDGARWTFKGYVKKFGTEGETEDGVLTNTVSIKLTSKPVFTESPS